MSATVKIVECPRDAWQAMARQIPVERKADYLRKLIAAGFRHIDAVSFVSPALIPQMADSEQVLKLVDSPRAAECIGIVVNEKGAERAIATQYVQTLGFPYSISAEFLRRNQKQTPAEALRMLNSIATLAAGAGLNVVVYVSMAFGNPYEDPWSIDDLKDACSRLIDAGLKQISLADTVGLATPARIAESLDRVLPLCHEVEFGVHLHARPEGAAGKIRAAYEAGCRRFDAAIGGLGGCPFAQDALVGNIATEILIAELNGLGAHLPALQPLQELIHRSAEIERDFGVAGQGTILSSQESPAFGGPA
jgi:hydroxymethylglutaryl-CoA lyase